MKLQNRFTEVDTVLGSDVANNGTFTVSYPSGKKQGNFLYGLSAGGYAIVNDNDEYTVADAKVSYSFGSTTVTVTNLSGVTWTQGSKVRLCFDEQDGNDVEYVSFPVELASITGTQDVVTSFPLAMAGTVEHVQFVVNKPVTTASKLATIGVAIDGVNATGGSVALTSANCTPMGAVVHGADFTAGNKLSLYSVISLKASSVTAFAEGNGSLVVRVRKDGAQAAKGF